MHAEVMSPYSTKFGVDSSSGFSIRAWTHTDTNYPTHTSATTEVGKIIWQHCCSWSNMVHLCVSVWLNWSRHCLQCWLRVGGNFWLTSVSAIKGTVIGNKTANINDKNWSFSTKLTVMDQKLQKSQKDDITQHHGDIQATWWRVISEAQNRLRT